MARTSRWITEFVACLLLLTPLATAQLSNLPDLPGASGGAGNGNGGGGGNNNGGTPSSSAAANPAFHLTGLPTIAGAGIPDLTVPDTAGAPFMQKSSLPEGTFFIAVGATLAFLGACVLLWRAMVAWSMNRSVKRSANASMGEKSGHGSTMYGGWAGSRKSSGYHGLSKASLYETDTGSVSMENLTAAGKGVKSGGADRTSSLPQDLFFSPTAHARDSAISAQRGSTYMPAGFYASSAAQAGNGATNTTLGASLAPYAQSHKRQSTIGSESSMPTSAAPQSRGSTTLRGVSRDGPLDGGFRAGSREPSGRFLYANPSSSSLMVGQSSNGSDATPSRAPSAYLDDLFENHGMGPRERF